MKKLYYLDVNSDINAIIKEINSNPHVPVILKRQFGFQNKTILLKHFCDIIANTSLTNLDLSSDNLFNYDEIKQFTEALKINKSLIKLNLSDNKIDVEGIKSIVEVLKTNQSLTGLDLSVNNIGAEGAKFIAEALQTNKSLTRLDLYYTRIGVEGIKFIGEALKTNVSLTTLNLENNKIGNEGAKFIVNALKTNVGLTKLNLENNKIGNEGAKYIINVIKYNFAITSLLINATEEEQQGLVEYLTRNKEYTTSLADFIYENNKEISKGYYGNLSLLKVAKIPPFSPAFNIQNEKLIASEGVFSFFALFKKVGKSFLKECLSQKFLEEGRDQEEKTLDYIINNFKNLQAANYFTFNRICNDSINDFMEEEKTCNNIFNILPKKISE